MKIRDRIKEFRRVKASELAPNPRNWRTHPKAQKEALRGLLAEIGFAGAVLARETPQGLMLIDGHLRTETCPESEIPCLILDVTEDEGNKILATFDPLSAMADTDSEILDGLLRNVQTESQSVADMLTELAKDAGLYLGLEKEEIVEDELPELPANPITKPGDLWILGDHRLLCGDSTKAEDVGRLMNGTKAEMCFTSPPYNADTGAGDGDIFNRKARKKLYAEEYKDNLSSDGYVDFVQKALRLCFDATAGFIFWNVGYNARSRFEYIKQIGPWLPHLIEQICWKKHSAIPVKGSMRRAWEPVYLFSTNGETLGLESVESNFWDISNTGCQADGHKACFPVALPAKGMQLISSACSVYEPFCGSGTTLIAAEQLGRKCYGMEISPQYCDLIVKRWEKLTEKKATLE